MFGDNLPDTLTPVVAGNTDDVIFNRLPVVLFCQAGQWAGQPGKHQSEGAQRANNSSKKVRGNEEMRERWDGKVELERRLQECETVSMSLGNDDE